MGTAGIAPSRG